MKRTRRRSRAVHRLAEGTAQQRSDVLARLSATVDPRVLAIARAFAEATGFRNSFSAYLNDVLDRDNKQRSRLLSARPPVAHQVELPL